MEINNPFDDGTYITIGQGNRQEKFGEKAVEFGKVGESPASG